MLTHKNTWYSHPLKVGELLEGLLSHFLDVVVFKTAVEICFLIFLFYYNLTIISWFFNEFFFHVGLIKFIYNAKFIRNYTIKKKIQQNIFKLLKTNN